ncbi:MAG TPA: response regulator [Blastocatellia bacterium]|nr:response regulator [Blastocatellia bacterium]
MRRPCILVAEDNADLRQLYTFVLATKGFKVRGAVDGEEAYAVMQKERPDALLTDIFMPNMDGVELIRQVRGDDQFTDLPVVAMSAFGDENLSQACEAGANETLAKPFEPDELFDALLRVLPKEHGH